jgi:hypothetical protein
MRKRRNHTNIPAHGGEMELDPKIYYYVFLFSSSFALLSSSLVELLNLQAPLRQESNMCI